MESYLEIIDTRTGDAKVTGIGAVFETNELTREAFESARPLHREGGGFMLDLYIDGDLIDSIELDADGVALVSGVEPKSAECYAKYDKAEWDRAMQLRLGGLIPEESETAVPPPPELFYIVNKEYSKSGVALMWRPNNRGYTTDLKKAGQYTREECERLGVPELVFLPVKDLGQEDCLTCIPDMVWVNRAKPLARH